MSDKLAALMFLAVWPCGIYTGYNLWKGRGK